MKKRNKILALLLVGLVVMNTSPISSQNSSSEIDCSICGIYVSGEDYAKHNLAYSFNCESSGKIKLHHFFSGRHIDIVMGGKKTRLDKDSIFGYRNCKNEDYRFYKTYDEEYQILENKGIIIYLSYVKVSSYNAKGIQLAPAYFFSRTIDSEILPLTISNLKKALPDNYTFQSMLSFEFGGGEALYAYSATDKMYKVNVLLNKSNLK
jgi:hypothetical protein